MSRLHGWIVLLAIGSCHLAQGCAIANKGTVPGAAQTPPVSQGHCNELRPTPLAQFRFDGDATNSGQGDARFDLKNTRFKNGSLDLNGNYEHGPRKGYRAICEVPGFDYAAFTVAIRYKPQSLGESNILMGGTSYRWFGIGSSRVGGPGIVEKEPHLTISMNNGQYRFHLDASLQEKKWAVVVCCVDLSAGKLVVYLNGKKVDGEQWPYEGFKFKVIGSPAEKTDKKWTFTDYSNGRAFHGRVDELILYNGLLSEDQINWIPLKP